MTYTTGQLIEATDYNGFAANTVNANVNDIWGVGSGDKGWGQTSTLATVAAGGTVTAAQWADLNSRISSMGSQTGTAVTARTSPTAGQTISVLSNINTDLAALTTNRGNTTNLAPIYQIWTGGIAVQIGHLAPSTQPWTITWTHTITFPSAAQARYFWNAGGLIQMDMSKLGNVTDADADWNAFVAQVGSLVLSGRVNNAPQVIGTTYTGFNRIGGTGGTQNVLLSTTGWYTLVAGAAASTMFQLQNTVSPYTGDLITVSAAVNATRTTLTLTTVWSDSGTGQSSNISGGTNTPSPFSGSFGNGPAVLVRYYAPSTDFLTNTWGTPTIAASVVTAFNY
jgi:hypothetical protein